MHVGNTDLKDLNVGYDLQDIEVFRQEDRWFQFAESAAMMRIQEGVRISISDREWAKIRGVLFADIRAKWWENAAHLAAAMKVLAAGEVRVTEDSLKITMRKAKEFEKSHKVPESIKL